MFLLVWQTLDWSVQLLASRQRQWFAGEGRQCQEWHVCFRSAQCTGTCMAPLFPAPLPDVAVAQNWFEKPHPWVPSLCQQQFLMQMWPEWCKPCEQKGLFNLCQLHCATLAFFHQLHNYRYFLEVSTEIEQSSIDQHSDIQEKKKMIHIF